MYGYQGERRGWEELGDWDCHIYALLMLCNFAGGSRVKNLTANAGDVGSIPGLGKSPGGENGNPLQYSCLDKGRQISWTEEPGGPQSTVSLKSWTQLSDSTTI